MTNRDKDSPYNRLSQALDFHFRQKIKNLHTSIPGVVRSYNRRTKRASVQVAINMLLTDGSSMPRAVLTNVPLAGEQYGGYAMNFPVKAGDAVMLAFSERGLDQFKSTFGVSNPPSRAIMREQDAVIVGGFGSMELQPIDPPTRGLSIQSEDGKTYISIDEDGIRIKAERIDLDGDVYVDGERIP